MWVNLKTTILLNYNENLKKIEEEEKDKFLYLLLTEMGVPILELWDLEKELSLIQKAELRNIITKYGVQIIEEFDGAMEVYVENKCVGKWSKPTYKIRRDHSQIDRKKQLYIELELDYWSIFEENK